MYIIQYHRISTPHKWIKGSIFGYFIRGIILTTGVSKSRSLQKPETGIVIAHNDIVQQGIDPHGAVAGAATPPKFRLTVTDPGGLSSTDTCTVTIIAVHNR